MSSEEYEVIENSFKKFVGYLRQKRNCKLDFVEDLKAIVKPVNIKALEQFKTTGVLHRISLFGDIQLLEDILKDMETCESVERIKNAVNILKEVQPDDIYKVIEKAGKQKERNEKLFLFLVKKGNLEVLKKIFGTIDIDTRTLGFALYDAHGRKDNDMINWLTKKEKIYGYYENSPSWSIVKILIVSGICYTLYKLPRYIKLNFPCIG